MVAFGELRQSLVSRVQHPDAIQQHYLGKYQLIRLLFVFGLDLDRTKYQQTVREMEA